MNAYGVDVTIVEFLPRALQSGVQAAQQCIRCGGWGIHNISF
jgi:hypothetical protein